MEQEEDKEIRRRETTREPLCYWSRAC